MTVPARIQQSGTICYGSRTLERHAVLTQDGVQLSVLRTPRPEVGGSQPKPVVLIHGCYTNRHFWITTKGKGFAAWLAEHGFDVWIPETRGHGFSSQPETPSKLTADAVIQHDLPALAQYIHGANPQPQTWVGHSYGGLYLLGALGTEPTLRQHVCCAVAIGTQLALGQRYLRLPLIGSALKAMVGAIGRFPARILGMGPEDEPAGIMKQILTWKSQGQWCSENGLNYTEALRNVNCPVLSVTCTGDRIDPWEGCQQLHDKIGSTQKEFWCMSRNKGWKSDYGHAEMVVSKPAQEEVWPRLTDWIRTCSPTDT